MTSARGAALTALADLLRSAAFARAYTLTALAAAFLTTAVHSVNGPVTLATIVAGLAVAAAIYLLSFRGGVAGTRLILIGIGMAAVLDALTNYVLQLTALQMCGLEEDLFSIDRNLASEDFEQSLGWVGVVN